LFEYKRSIADFKFSTHFFLCVQKEIEEQQKREKEEKAKKQKELEEKLLVCHLCLNIYVTFNNNIFFLG
jgi:hypothetical protein